MINSLLEKNYFISDEIYENYDSKNKADELISILKNQLLNFQIIDDRSKIIVNDTPKISGKLGRDGLSIQNDDLGLVCVMGNEIIRKCEDPNDKFFKQLLLYKTKNLSFFT